MATLFALPIRVSYPDWWRRATHSQRLASGMAARILPNSGASGTDGVIVTPVRGCSCRGVILRQRTICAGRGTSTSGEIRCAPDLILSPKERADG